MNQQKQNDPLGIFDSGIGGLTVARAVQTLMPQEDFIYFGDTAHLPYGDKSTAAIQAYCIKICNFLLSRRCKVILIACNSASAAAYELVKEYVGSKARVMSVIEPTIAYVAQKYEGKAVGLIGTKQTVYSNVYQKKIDQLHKDIQLQSLATPLLVPMIEEGFFQNNISREVIHNYLSSPELQHIKGLILGCTHYPLIRSEITEYYQGSIEIIDSSQTTAEALRNLMQSQELLNPQTQKGEQKFYVSDFTQSFEVSAKSFFGEQIQLEHYPLWE